MSPLGRLSAKRAAARATGRGYPRAAACSIRASRGGSWPSTLLILRRGLRRAGRHVNVVEPVAVALGAAAESILEHPLDRAGDLTRRPDLDPIDRAHRRQLGGRAGQEHLVGERELGSSYVALDDGVAEVARDLDHGLAIDA